MAWDLGDVSDLLRGLSDWPDLSSSKPHGPARKRVGRWTGRTLIAVSLVTAIAAFVVWARSEDFDAFDKAALPVVSLGLMALVAVVALHCVAAFVANRIDRRASER